MPTSHGCPWLLPLLLTAVSAGPSEYFRCPGCLSEQLEEPPPVAPGGVPTKLDMTLMKQVTQNLSENEAISPFVVSSLMTQVFLGTDGTTRDEMRPILGVEPDPYAAEDTSFLDGYQSAIDYLSSGTANVTVGVFNRMYVRPGFYVKEQFSNKLRAAYRSDALKITSSEQTAREINDAVANVTHGKIGELVSARQLSNTELVLISALYFKGLWKYPFDPAEKGYFLTANGEQQVDMMSLQPQLLLYGDLTKFEAVVLPYTDPDFCMLLLRPSERSMESVQELHDILNTLDIADIMEQLFVVEMGLSMPKFKIEAEYSLTEPLSSLGIREIFGGGHTDFSRLTDEPGVHVSDVIHKVFIEVTEEGTEAAGAAVAFFLRSMPTYFAMDRPFFAVVYNKRHKINMFSAFVASPSSEPTHEYDADSQQEPTPTRYPPYYSRFPRLQKARALTNTILERLFPNAHD